MENIISNPRMTNPDGVYACEARSEDYVSLLDHFAGQAMTSLISRIPITTIIDEELLGAISLSSYSIAQAMLKARNQVDNLK